ncbi:uncharacterized protein LOC128361794 [Scomber scombrus]|uniref:Uncharacterized protein LOC128361794 n=1 Tax=Scomber scombrus TaxID=13677 RepID=A0AAV1N9D9_SCOSC
MNILLISSLLDVLKVSVFVWPKGSTIYLGEWVLLRCAVESNSSNVLRYSWLRPKTQAAQTPNPRHLVSGDSYSITVVTREDADSYQCQVESRSSNTTTKVLSEPVTLSVSELPPPSLTLTPNTRQMFRGEHFTVRCPQTNSSGWILKYLPQGRRAKTKDFPPDMCSPRWGPDGCIFTASNRSTGLYWCVGAEGRSNAVNIIVSYGAIILKTPAFPVPEGGNVVLSCQYLKENKSNTTFFKNGEEIGTLSSKGVTEMTIENVTKADEGFYKCVAKDRKMESPESWLSVAPEQGNSTSTYGTAPSIQGSWKWIIVSCVIVLLFLTLLAVWLVCHYRYQMFCTRSCWPLSKEDIPAVALPAIKQDVTEVQWDVSWMEMSNLLDKHLYPGLTE